MGDNKPVEDEAVEENERTMNRRARAFVRDEKRERLIVRRSLYETFSQIRSMAVAFFPR